MDKRGDKLISMYWFVILFLVTGGVVYMAGVFYGTPYDVTDVEERILGNKVADCIAKGGRLRADVFEDDFAENFLEKCGLNFAVEDSFGWNDNQYYVEVGFFEFDVDKERGFGDLVKTLKVGNPNLKVAFEIEASDYNEKNFYALDEDSNAYLVNVVSLVRKSEKNVK